MLDLTKEIKLDPSLQKRYLRLRALLYALFTLAVIFTAYGILFPSSTLVFFFDNANSLKNTLVSPRVNSTNSLPSKGNVPANDVFTLNANPEGSFSSAKITFTLAKGSPSIENTSLTIKKSYQAFFYPDGETMGFKNGSLLTVGKNYYIVSNGLMRRFTNADLATSLGYDINSFSPITLDDLQYNKSGDDIIDKNSYPNDTLFSIDGTFYMLRSQVLLPFISQRAFLSQFDTAQAIQKNEDFFSTYPLSDSAVGFADGTLASSDQSIFILSGNKSYPIENAITFLAMGFDFNNVIVLTPDELGSYERQKQFTHDQPHPDGTLFFDQSTKEYSVVENGQKRPLKSQAVYAQYAKQKAIIADSKGAETKATCIFKKNTLSPNAYSCTAPLNTQNSFIGNDYQIDAEFSKNIKVQEIDTTFSTPFSWESMKTSLSKIKSALGNNYGTTQ